MDIHCSTCGEPWDVYHLRHEAIFDIGLSEEQIKLWRALPQQARLAPYYRQKFKAVGWDFGASILDVRHCPCCPKGAQINPARAAEKAALTEVLGQDEDGLAAMFEDLGL